MQVSSSQHQRRSTTATAHPEPQSEQHRCSVTFADSIAGSDDDDDDNAERNDHQYQQHAEASTSHPGSGMTTTGQQRTGSRRSSLVDVQRRLAHLQAARSDVVFSGFRLGGRRHTRHHATMPTTRATANPFVDEVRPGEFLPTNYPLTDAVLQYGGGGGPLLGEPKTFPASRLFQPYPAAATLASDQGEQMLSKTKEKPMRGLAKVAMLMGLQRPAKKTGSSEAAASRQAVAAAATVGTRRHPQPHRPVPVDGAAVPPMALRSPKQRVVVFFDISCAGRHVGRVHFELFDDICPRTCENFRQLCLGTAGMSSTGTPLHYKGTRLFRIIQNFVIQGGDVTHDDGSGGECIWAKRQGGRFNRYFMDENFDISHSCSGLLSMANRGPNTNQSQFFITCAPLPWLDGRSVVFGKVIKGFDTLTFIEGLGSLSGAVCSDVRIAESGAIDAFEPEDAEDLDPAFTQASMYPTPYAGPSERLTLILPAAYD